MVKEFGRRCPDYENRPKGWMAGIAPAAPGAMNGCSASDFAGREELEKIRAAGARNAGGLKKFTTMAVIKKMSPACRLHRC